MLELSANAERKSEYPNLDNLALKLSVAGYYYVEAEELDLALKNFNEALKNFKNLGDEDDIASVLHNRSAVYFARGKYDLALRDDKEALIIYKKFGKEDQIGSIKNNIGVIYRAWGNYDLALKNYQEAFKIYKKHGKEFKSSAILNNIGSIYQSLGKHDLALKKYQKSLKIRRKLGSEKTIAFSIDRIAGAYQSLGKYELALKNYKDSLKTFRNFGLESSIALNLYHTGITYQSLGKYDLALKDYQEALKIRRKFKQVDELSFIYSAIGGVFSLKNNYQKAVIALEKSIELKEKIRKTAAGDLRRDYLASQIRLYRDLISTHVLNNNASAAFEILELSRAKLLKERIGEAKLNIKIKSVNEIQNTLDEDVAILLYSNFHSQNIVEIVLTKNDIYGKQVSLESFIDHAEKKYKKPMGKVFESIRDLKLGKETTYDTFAYNIEKEGNLENIINYYRALLKNASLKNGSPVRKSQISKDNTREIGRMLYDFLVNPIAEHIKGKKELVIIPDGFLSFIPFETLIDQKGKYMVENYKIKYSQSMGILELLKNRKYKKERKPLLALGGAVYDEIKYETDIVENMAQLAFIKNKLYPSFKNKHSVRDAYDALDKASWDNLPGTLDEVRAINKIVKDSEMLTGDTVTENNVKTLSRNGDLAKYKILHFATHGLVVSELPELSALVLSQFKEEQDSEDGYLRMGEISKLHLKADFVNLSACKTGLGKIYGGEGVVGLTQAFLIAGANAVSVSLWSVEDISTSQFMTGMYKLAEELDIEYNEAMTIIKRKFIRGEFGNQYREPFYWAPFVYYGK
tara:strand:+ start:177 stop:2588 length:2412 start_codon:yes stop_codon:yes gene_type:complete